MPRLQVWEGRYIHASSDDYVGYGLCGIVLRVLWGVAFLLATLDAFDTSKSCAREARAVLLGLTVVHGIGILVSALLAIHSGRGALIEVEKRRHVGILIFLHDLVLFFELAGSILGVYGAFFHPSVCRAVADDTPILALFRASVIITMVSSTIGIILSLGLVASAPTGEVWERTRAPAPKRVAAWGHRWRRRCGQWACCCGADTEERTLTLERVGILMAAALHTTERLGMTASDLGAGLALVRTQQRARDLRERRLAAARRVHQNVQEAQQLGVRSEGGEWSTVPVPPESGGVAVVPRLREGSQRHLEDLEEGGRGGGGGDGAPHPPPPLKVSRSVVKPSKQSVRGAKPLDVTSDWQRRSLWEATHFFGYALGVYGHLLYAYQYCGPVAWCHLGCAQLGCVGKPMESGIMTAEEVERGERGDMVEGDCCGCNLTAARMMTRVDPRSFLVARFTNTLTDRPFLVVRDRKTRTLVIAVRGTLSLSDAVADADAVPEDIRHDPGVVALWAQCGRPQPRGRMAVHGGMWRASGTLEGLLAKKGVLDEAETRQEYAPGEEGGAGSGGRGGRGVEEPWGIVVVGHSLGAGVATLLTIRLLARFPHVRCYAYSPPGGLLSPALAAALGRRVMPVPAELGVGPSRRGEVLPIVNVPVVTSVVLGKDLVPRLSVVNLRKLQADMLRAMLASRVSKSRLFCSVVMEWWRKAFATCLCCGGHAEMMDGWRDCLGIRCILEAGDVFEGGLGEGEEDDPLKGFSAEELGEPLRPGHLHGVPAQNTRHWILAIRHTLREEEEWLAGAAREQTADPAAPPLEDTPRPRPSPPAAPPAAAAAGALPNRSVAAAADPPDPSSAAAPPATEGRGGRRLRGGDEEEEEGAETAAGSSGEEAAEALTNLQQPMVMGGRVMHLAKVATYRSTCCGSCSAFREYDVFWARPESFDEILVSALMMQDHMPDRVEGILRNIATQTLGVEFTVPSTPCRC